MKHLRIFCLLALACFAMSAFAQAAKPAATPNAQAKKTAPPTIASASRPASQHPGKRICGRC